MGICPVCGSYIDPGDPYCSDCGYIPQGSSSTAGGNLDFSDFDEDELEEALESRGYDMDDFENDLVDEIDLEEIYEELSL